MFFALALVVYAPALNGTFVSDDEHYVERNVFVHDPLDNWVAIIDPTSVLAEIIENYAPVHVLLHALEWQLFGPETVGYHVVNVAVHALVSLLLVLLLRRSGVSAEAAAIGGAFFLVHAANVEAVAWISQLKTSSAMALCLGALLLHPRRALLASLLFALALMAKPTAAVALFFVGVMGWSRGSGREADSNWKWPWLGLWAVLLIAFAIAELAVFAQTTGQAPPLYADAADRLRSTFAISLRYLVMAGTTIGLSTFHEPEAAGPFDPWWLASLPVLAVLGWRTMVCLKARRTEAAWWIFAVVSFGPVCGLIPLPFPMADRYLYFMLPGLIGGVALALPDLLEHASVSPSFWKRVRIGVLALLVLLAVRSFDRARVWRFPASVMADSIIHYPDGVAAKTQLATAAAQSGDARTAVALLREAHARGYNRLDHLLRQPYAPIEGDPDFEELKRGWAKEWIERLSAGGGAGSQHELRLIAQAELVLDDLEAARDAILAGIERGGPITDRLEADLEEVERAIRFSRLR